MELTHRWLDRCISQFNNTDDKYGYAQNLFPIVQGVHSRIFAKNLRFISSKNAVGNAIGDSVLANLTKCLFDDGIVLRSLPENKPRYLMGVGTPWNILECIGLGIDMFDCVMPTRNGRNAMLFTSKGVINIDNKKWEKDFSPIDEALIAK